MKLLKPLSFLVLVAAVVGCGGSQTPAKLKGIVTYKGQPLPGGNMTFSSDSGGGGGATINSDGSYSVTDLPVGTISVAIDTESFNPDRSKIPSYGDKKEKNSGSRPAAGSKVPEGGESGMQAMRRKAEGVGGGGAGGGGFGPASAEDLAKMYVKIPSKYSDKRTSGLRVEVTRGVNEKNFELTD